MERGRLWHSHGAEAGHTEHASRDAGWGGESSRRSEPPAPQRPARRSEPPAPLDYNNGSFGDSRIMVASHGAPMPLGPKTAQEILSAQTPKICNMPAQWTVRGLSLVVISWNVFSLLSLAITELEKATCVLSISVYAVGLVTSFTLFSAPKLAQAFYLLVAAELVVVLGADVYKVTQVHAAVGAAGSTNVTNSSAAAAAAAERSGGGGAVQGDDGEGLNKEPNMTVAVFSLLVNLILHAGCLFCARRFHRILIYDLECWPEMEATMEVPPEMNRIGMPSHDAGIPAHDAHFRVTGLRLS